MPCGPEASGQLGDVVGTDLATAADNCGARRDPFHCMIGIVLRAEVDPSAEGVDGGGVLQKPFGDAVKAIGKGPKGQIGGLENRKRRAGWPPGGSN